MKRTDCVSQAFFFAEEVAFSIASPSKFDSRPFEELCRPRSFVLGKNTHAAIFRVASCFCWGRLGKAGGSSFFELCVGSHILGPGSHNLCVSHAFLH